MHSRDWRSAHSNRISRYVRNAESREQEKLLSLNVSTVSFFPIPAESFTTGSPIPRWKGPSKWRRSWSSWEIPTKEKLKELSLEDIVEGNHIPQQGNLKSHPLCVGET